MPASYGISMNIEHAGIADPQATLENLRKLLAAGAKVRDCEVRQGRVVVVFADRECPAPGFVVGTPCRPFAEFVVEAGLDREVDLVEIYLAALPTDIEGGLCWPGFEPGDTLR